jgi:hypothetical protein
MTFRSNPPRKLAVAATVDGKAYLFARVSFARLQSRQSRQGD